MANPTHTYSAQNLLSGASTSANALAGALTAQIREIERLRCWHANRELRHWHHQFSEARLLLTTKPTRRVDRYAPVELPDDDNATWLELIGAQ
jgi:hypothetical protein